MADIPLRVNPAQDIRQIKALRLNRKNNRGLYVNTSTGFSSRDRRDVIDRADDIATGNNQVIVRRRLRRGWSLQDALTTPQAA
jgi:ribosome-binding protein aMBF1 (putative translation factor)